MADIPPDVPPDVPPDAPADAHADVPPPPVPDPFAWGPYEVGMTTFQFFDLDRLRSVPTTVWYPAKPAGQAKARYLVLIPGRAYAQASADTSGAPYPLVMFSHGFRGIAEQSIGFTEHLASHGYVVAAMNHAGNTLTDFFSSDETVAKVAMERPRDVAFAAGQVIERAGTPGYLVTGIVDATRVAVTGHSFGGYTALMIAGGSVDVSAVQATCAAGTPADIMCDYVPFWPSGQVVTASPLPGLRAAIALAPGGIAAFGPQGLSGVKVPVAVFGGTLDPTCPVDIETHPIYLGLPAPKAEGIVESASHMSYTNVCDIPLSDQTLKDYCGVEGMLEDDETFAIMIGTAVSWLKLYVEGETGYAQYLDPAWLAANRPALQWTYEEP
ncbi:MAG: hypothetical protein FJ087_12195 [Deltaproteobacteria bacterium]|nr:hypothetical protein [Deltaproteobacteria bacterium]